MVNRYLEKIASQRKEDSTGKKVLKSYVSLGLGNAAALPLAAAGQAAGMKTMQMVHHDHSASDLGTIKKFMRDNKLHKNVTFNHRSHQFKKQNLSHAQRSAVESANLINTPAYMENSGGKGFVVGVKKKGGTVNKDVIMHELGHAKDFRRHTTLKQIGTVLGRHSASKAAFGAATVGALTNDKTRDYAPAIATVPGALVMREELAANYHAYKGVKAHKGAKAGNKFLRNLVGKNTANYGLIAGVPVAAAYVGKKVMDKWSPRKTEGKS